MAEAAPNGLVLLITPSLAGRCPPGRCFRATERGCENEDLRAQLVREAETQAEALGPRNVPDVEEPLRQEELIVLVAVLLKPPIQKLRRYSYY